MNQSLPTAIIGGGPVAMAAAAQLIKRNMPFILFERGTEIGSSVLSWKHVRMFSPWAFNIDSAARELLLSSGWQAPDKEHMPTGEELVNQYIEPLSKLDSIAPYIKLESKVTSIHRKGLDKMKSAGREHAPFIVEYERQGKLERIEVSSVIDASGTWITPNPIGSGGHYADGEKQHAERIVYGIPDILGADRNRYAGKNVVVIGGGHSAIQALTLLHELKLGIPETTIHWVLRKPQVSDAFGGGENDGLPARGALGTRAKDYVQNGNILVHTPFLVTQIRMQEDTRTLSMIGTSRDDEYELNRIDEIIVATGSRPDFDFLRELRYSYDPSVESVPQLAELIDPNIHSCGTVRPHGEAELRQPEKNFYIVGSKSYGRAPTFLLATGYEQVRSVVAALAGDYDAARDVMLQLPETGVCSVPKSSILNIPVTSSAGCCGPIAEAGAPSCGPASTSC